VPKKGGVVDIFVHLNDHGKRAKHGGLVGQENHRTRLRIFPVLGLACLTWQRSGNPILGIPKLVKPPFPKSEKMEHFTEVCGKLSFFTQLLKDVFEKTLPRKISCYSNISP